MQAIAGGCAFINATPNFIASDPSMAVQFEDANLPLVGDDLVDQIGSTSLHKTLLKLLSDSGVHINETYQLDVGGGNESVDTQERTRDTKRDIKTETVPQPYHTRPSRRRLNRLSWISSKNKRDSYFFISGVYFCNTPLKIDLKFQTVDAPNAGSILFDVVRAVKLAKTKKQGGAIEPVCAYGFKHPPKQVPMETAEAEFKKFWLKTKCFLFNLMSQKLFLSF